MTDPVVEFVGVHGSGSSTPKWLCPDSPLRQHLRSLGWAHVDHEHGLFDWSGEVGRLFWVLNSKDWPAAARSLKFYMDHRRLPIISHSHGAQVVVRYAAAGHYIPVWIDISGPIRKDTLRLYAAAKPFIGRHVYVHDASRWGDLTRLGGQLFDASFGFPVKHPDPDVVDVPLHGVGHSKVLNDPLHLGSWSTILALAEAALL